MDGGWDGVYVVRWEAVMPKYVLKIEAVFEADEPLGREARRKIVRKLRDAYVEKEGLESDVQDTLTCAQLDCTSTRLAKKPALVLSFEPQL